MKHLLAALMVTVFIPSFAQAITDAECLSRNINDLKACQADLDKCMKARRLGPLSLTWTIQCARDAEECLDIAEEVYQRCLRSATKSHPISTDIDWAAGDVSY